MRIGKPDQDRVQIRIVQVSAGKDGKLKYTHAGTLNVYEATGDQVSKIIEKALDSASKA
jgi:hypothetical protein